MKERGKIVLWQVYFDSTKTRTEGRRVPKKLATPSPKLSDIQTAAQQLRLKYEVVEEAAYPRSPWRKVGYITVSKEGPKAELLERIAKNLSKPGS